MIDSHTHSSFSFDSHEPIENMLAEARSKGLDYFAVTEHWDYDYIAEGFGYEQLDLDAYRTKLLQLKQQSKDMFVAFGTECGYSPLASQYYVNSIPNYPFDVIINSVHLVDGVDVYRNDYYEGKDKNKIYCDYFHKVRESLEVPYRYDVIGHIGFAMRYLPSDDKSLTMDAKDIVQDIFTRAIELGKTVEVNTHVRQTGLGSVPTKDMLQLYKELGGEDITFGSDAHQTARLCERWEEATAMLRSLGYRYFTTYKQGKKEFVKI